MQQSLCNQLNLPSGHAPICFISYYVITTLMSTVFEGKIRRLGNSMAVIIPKEILEETGARGGDGVKLAVAIPKQGRREVVKQMAGNDAESQPFTREKRDRLY